MERFRCSPRAVSVLVDSLPPWCTTRKSQAKSTLRLYANTCRNGLAMTPDELNQIAETEGESLANFRHRLNICVAAGCLSCQSQPVKDALEQDVARREWGNHCQVKGAG